MCKSSGSGVLIRNAMIMVKIIESEKRRRILRILKAA
jgi:hypothetical protein